MRECPSCHRPLLSHASPCCSWCGREIPYAAYQRRAEGERARFFLEQARHDAQALARLEMQDGFLVQEGLLWQTPLVPLPAPAPPTPMARVARTRAAEDAAPEDVTGARFRHLDI